MRIGLLYSLAEKNLTGINRLTKGTLLEVIRTDRKNEYYSLDDNYLNLDIDSTQPYLLELSSRDRRLSDTQLTDTMAKLMDLKIYANDIQLIHSYYKPFDTMKSKCKKVITIYDITPSVHPEWARGKEYYDTAIKKSAECADQIIAISKYTKTDLVNYYNIKPDKITVIYPGVDTNLQFDMVDELLLPKQVKANDYILSVCSLAPHKNLQGVIDGFANFKRQHTDSSLKLVLCGRPIPGHDLMKYIETLNHIKEDIIFTGFIDDLQLTALYKYAVGVAYISFYEGFGLPILEAMAAGKAVISSDTTSMPEVGGEAVLYCNPYSSDSILEAISTLVLDDTKRKEMEKQGALQSKKFSYKKAAQETIELYQKLV